MPRDSFVGQGGVPNATMEDIEEAKGRLAAEGTEIYELDGPRVRRLDIDPGGAYDVRIIPTPEQTTWDLPIVEGAAGQDTGLSYQLSYVPNAPFTYLLYLNVTALIEGQDDRQIGFEWRVVDVSITE